MALSVAKMNACSVATRPSSKRKSSDAGRQQEDAERLQPEQHGEPARHEQDDQVAGEDVGEESNGEMDMPYWSFHASKSRLSRTLAASFTKPMPK